jgi:hypothetical protein
MEKLDDPQFGKGKKMSYAPPGTGVEIHYVATFKNDKMTTVADFKFKNNNNN